MYFAYLFELIRNVFAFASLMSMVILFDTNTNMQAYFNKLNSWDCNLNVVISKQHLKTKYFVWVP